jgi:hypothetical protein
VGFGEAFRWLALGQGCGFIGRLYMGTPRVICTWGLFLGLEIQVGKRSRTLVAKRSAWGRKTVKNFDHKTDVMGSENGRENGVGICFGKQT